MQATKIADVARDQGMSVDKFAICRGLVCCPDVIRVEFGLEEQKPHEDQ